MTAEQKIADAIRTVTATAQTQIERGRRSVRIDANDVLDLLLEIARLIDPPVPAGQQRCEFCDKDFNRDGKECPYCGHPA
jgi:hypothetical protein